jgi:hypothetical protein
LPCYFGGKPIDLLSKPDLDFLIANIEAIESDAGAPMGFLVVDTQSRTMGGDENSTKDGAAYAKAIEAIRQATEATLWIIAHTGHSEEAQDRPPGSSALLGAYDTFYRHKKTDERSVCAPAESRHGRPRPPVALGRASSRPCVQAPSGAGALRVLLALADKAGRRRSGRSASLPRQSLQW